MPDLLEFEIRLAAVFESHFSTKFFLTFSRPLVLKSCSTLENVLVPWDLPKIPEIGAGVETLLCTDLGFDRNKVVQAILELSKSFNLSSLNLNRTLPIS